MHVVLLMMAAIVACAGFSGPGKSERVEPQKKKDVLEGTIQGLRIYNIMTSRLELVEGTEVVVSRVEIPANTTLPKHWHPGEEFIYVLEGSAILWQKDKSDTHLKKGDVFKVPLKQIHTAKTGEEAATLLVFRVHEMGQPVRVNVE
ncbi:MAG: cupin domain-containing protein [Thermodesulfobacteriota bacterium]